MYKMSLLLKFILVVFTVATVVLTGNRIILWFLLFLLTFYNLYKKKRLLLILDLLLVLFLGLSTSNELALLIFKIGYICTFLVTVIDRLSQEEVLNILRITNRKKSAKIEYFEDNFDRVVERAKIRKTKFYNEEVSIDNEIERSLDRNYLQSKIRYYGIYNSGNKVYNWNRIDTLILLFAIVVFVILFILR